jgi:hypothetical protein
MTGSVVLLQKKDVRGHIRVDFSESGCVGELDDEHGHPACLTEAPR